MSRYTVAYSEFVGRTGEVLILVRRAGKLERSARAFEQGDEINALCRGAIVLLSSHIEAYIKELAECLLDEIHSRSVDRSVLSDRFYYYASKEWVNKLKDSIEPESISAEVFGFLDTEADLWRRNGPLPRPIDSEKFCKGFANPKFEKIKRFLGRFGYDALRHHINITHRGDAALLISHLEQIVDTRNAIAHGESSATRTPAEVMTLIKSSKKFCRTVDDGFATWAKSTICPIR